MHQQPTQLMALAHSLRIQITYEFYVRKKTCPVNRRG